MEQFLKELASKEPTPGGGGASALLGSVSAALCSMVANLTTGKKKYAQYQEDIERILKEMETGIWKIHGFIEKDAIAFAPLAQAYSIPKDQPDREQILEKALLDAAVLPMELTETLYALVPVMEELELKGSRLAISDVAVAAAACEGALKGAVMNVYINTRLMKDKEKANAMNQKAMELEEDGSRRCREVYVRIRQSLLL